MKKKPKLFIQTLKLIWLLPFIIFLLFQNCLLYSKDEHYVFTGEKARIEQKFSQALNLELQLSDFRRYIQETPPLWMQKQIAEDFAFFMGKGIVQSDLSAFFENTDDFIARVRIIEGKAHLEAPLLTRDREFYRSQIESMQFAFDQLAKCPELEGLQMLLAYGDGSPNQSPSLPICAFAKNKTNCSDSILIPDCEALQGYFPLLKAASDMHKSLSWNKRKPQAIWRGNTTGLERFTVENFLSAPRSKLVTLSLQHPKYIDARFSKLSQCDNPKQVKAKYPSYFGGYSLPVSDHLNYKYQILIDGNTCAYSRAYWQLFSYSLCFKQESDEFQWYYGALKSGVHYVPVHHDMSDLIEKIRWAKKNDLMARTIALQAADFAFAHLTYSRVLQYLYLVCKEYKSLFNEEERSYF